MKSFQEFMLLEKFENLFLDDTDKRKQYVDELWDMLQKTYKDIGGLKTKGFESKESMIKNVPFWKVLKKNGKVVGGMFYKQKGGRKRVATCVDGSDVSKELLANAIKQEPQRSFFEVSKGSWGFIRKQFKPEDLKKFMIDVDAVREMNSRKKIYSFDEIPKTQLKKSGLDPKDSKNTPYKDFIYGRELEGEIEPKVMIGSIGKDIIQP